MNLGKRGFACLHIPPLVSSSVAIKIKINYGGEKWEEGQSRKSENVSLHAQKPNFYEWLCCPFKRSMLLFFRNSVFKIIILTGNVANLDYESERLEWGCWVGSVARVAPSLLCLLSEDSPVWCFTARIPGMFSVAWQDTEYLSEVGSCPGIEGLLK